MVTGSDSIWPVAHFFLGYSITLPILVFIIWLITRKPKVRTFRDYIKKRAPAGIIGGLWAMIPDIDYFLEEEIFTRAAWADIFFFHVSLDNILPETDLFFAGEMLLLFVVVNIFMMAAIIESFEGLKDVMFGKEEEEEEDEAETEDDVEVENEESEDPVEEAEEDTEEEHGGEEPDTEREDKIEPEPAKEETAPE